MQHALAMREERNSANALAGDIREEVLLVRDELRAVKATLAELRRIAGPCLLPVRRRGAVPTVTLADSRPELFT